MTHCKLMVIRREEIYSDHHLVVLPIEVNGQQQERKMKPCDLMSKLSVKRLGRLMSAGSVFKRLGKMSTLQLGNSNPIQRGYAISIQGTINLYPENETLGSGQVVIL